MRDVPHLILRGTTLDTDLEKSLGGPFVGPHGGQWADAKHTISWQPDDPHGAKAIHAAHPGLSTAKAHQIYVAAGGTHQLSKWQHHHIAAKKADGQVQQPAIVTTASTAPPVHSAPPPMVVAGATNDPHHAHKIASAHPGLGNTAAHKQYVEMGGQQPLSQWQHHYIKAKKLISAGTGMPGAAPLQAPTPDVVAAPVAAPVAPPVTPQIKQLVVAPDLHLPALPGVAPVNYGVPGPPVVKLVAPAPVVQPVTPAIGSVMTSTHLDAAPSGAIVVAGGKMHVKGAGGKWYRINDNGSEPEVSVSALSAKKPVLSKWPGDTQAPVMVAPGTTAPAATVGSKVTTSKQLNALPQGAQIKLGVGPTGVTMIKQENGKWRYSHTPGSVTGSSLAKDGVAHTIVHMPGQAATVGAAVTKEILATLPVGSVLSNGAKKTTWPTAGGWKNKHGEPYHDPAGHTFSNSVQPTIVSLPAPPPAAPAPPPVPAPEHLVVGAKVQPGTPAALPLGSQVTHTPYGAPPVTFTKYGPNNWHTEIGSMSSDAGVAGLGTKITNNPDTKITAVGTGQAPAKNANQIKMTHSVMLGSTPVGGTVLVHGVPAVKDYNDKWKIDGQLVSQADVVARLMGPVPTPAPTTSEAATVHFHKLNQAPTGSTAKIGSHTLIKNVQGNWALVGAPASAPTVNSYKLAHQIGQNGATPQISPPSAEPQTPVAPVLDAATVMGQSIGPQGGSNPGGVYLGTDGVKRYVKHYKDPVQAHGEVLANSIYNALGHSAPESVAVKHTDGKTSFASKLIEGHKGELGQQGGITQPLARESLKGFAADVLTANWDAAGLMHDNMVVKQDGGIARIDNGSAFLHRAQGSRKKDADLQQASAPAQMFDSGLNPSYAKLAKIAGYQKPTDIPDLPQQVDKIVALRDASGGWGAFVTAKAPGLSGADRDKTVAMLEARTKILQKLVA